MELAAVIIIVAAAAFAGVLALGVWWAARRWLGVSYPAYWFASGGALAGVLLSAAVIGGWTTDLLRTGEPVTVDQVLPFMAAIRKHDERFYERIETSVIRDQQDGKTPAEVRANARALVSSYVADKIPFLPDDLTYELYATTRDILAHLYASGDRAACAELALGRFRGDLDARLSRDLIERNDNTTLRVIVAAANRDAVKMPADEFAHFASTAFAEASQIAGIAPEEIDRLLAGDGEAVKTCKLMKGFIDNVLNHPVEVAAAALRTLAAGGGRSG